MINSLFIFGAMTFLKQKVEAIHKKRSTSKKTNKQILPRPILINWKVGSYYYSRHLSRHTKINKQKKWHCVPNASVHLNTLNLNLLEFSRRKRNWGETGRVWIHFVFLNCTWASVSVLGSCCHDVNVSSPTLPSSSFSTVLC